MPTLLRDTACSSCGKRHNFCVVGGSIRAGGRYEYACPETGTRSALRPDGAGESVSAWPQGAVGLTEAERPAPGSP